MAARKPPADEPVEPQDSGTGDESVVYPTPVVVAPPVESPPDPEPSPPITSSEPFLPEQGVPGDVITTETAPPVEQPEPVEPGEPATTNDVELPVVEAEPTDPPITSNEPGPAA
jgi:hypothetical protein